MAGENIITIDQENWQTEVIDSSTPVLVDFWAEWCGPCRAIAPMLEELSSELDGKLKIAKVNVDDHQPLAGQFGIQSIPTLLLFKGGDLVEQMVGAASKSSLMDKLGPHLN